MTNWYWIISQYAIPWGETSSPLSIYYRTIALCIELRPHGIFPYPL